VTSRARSLAFYQALGFRLDTQHSTDTALEIVNGGSNRSRKACPLCGNEMGRGAEVNDAPRIHQLATVYL